MLWPEGGGVGGSNLGSRFLGKLLSRPLLPRE